MLELRLPNLYALLYDLDFEQVLDAKSETTFSVCTLSSKTLLLSSTLVCDTCVKVCLVSA